MALIPPFFLDTVVAIGVGDDPAARRWIGTGFIYGDPLATESAGTDEEKLYQPWLITNKHVLTDLETIYIKFNSAAEPNSRDYRVTLISRNGRPQWVGHAGEEVDVAAIFLNAGALRREQRRFAFFRGDDHSMPKSGLKKDGVTEGDQVFVLGFPMGLVSPERQYVICRGGYIARLRDFLEEKAADFLVDCMVFPGNSGGPVILCPSALAIKGTKRIGRACLVGIVKSYVPYTDVAISQQTKQPRVVFEENSGLTVVESVDAIRETVELATRRIKGRRAQAKHRAKRKVEDAAPAA
jgi:hypothetical protein